MKRGLTLTVVLVLAGCEGVTTGPADVPDSGFLPAGSGSTPSGGSSSIGDPSPDGGSGSDGGPPSDGGISVGTGSGSDGGTRCTSAKAVFHASGDQAQCTSTGQGDPNGQYNFSSNWDVYDNMWNCNQGETLGPESIYACSTSSWYVTSAQWSQGGAVETYPAVQYNFNGGSGAKLSDYTSMTSTFSEVSPHVGIYEMTYDIWVNGMGWSAPGHTEFMIWVDNFGQTPLGGSPKLTHQSVGGGTYDVWYYSYSGGNQVISFVADTNFSSGTVDLLSFFKYAENKGWLASTSTILQLGFGPEIVSTQSPPTANNGANATFYIDDFTLNCSPTCP
jgi:hypothetical protein